MPTIDTVRQASPHVTHDASTEALAIQARIDSLPPGTVDETTATAALDGVLAGSPEMFVAIVAREVQRMQNDNGTSEVQRRRIQTENADGAHTRANDAADKAARDAAGFLGLGRVFIDVAKWVIAAVGVIGAAFTGGASMIAAIGAAIALCADNIVQALVEMKIVPEDLADEFTVGLQLVGTAMTLGTNVAAIAGTGLNLAQHGVSAAARGGAVDGTAAAVVNTVLSVAATATGNTGSATNTLKQVMTVVQTVAQGAQTATVVAATERQHASESARIDARSSQRTAENARTSIDEAISDVTEGQKRYRRLLSQLRESLTVRANGSEAALDAMRA